MGIHIKCFSEMVLTSIQDMSSCIDICKITQNLSISISLRSIHYISFYGEIWKIMPKFSISCPLSEAMMPVLLVQCMTSYALVNVNKENTLQDIVALKSQIIWYSCSQIRAPKISAVLESLCIQQGFLRGIETIARGGSSVKKTF